MSHEAASVHFGTQVIPFTIERSARRSTLSIEVLPDRKVLVRAPASCDRSVIELRVLRRARWVMRQLAHFQQFQPRTPPRRYLSGETHLYLGRRYRLKVEAAAQPKVSLFSGKLWIATPDRSQASVKTHLEHWYRVRAKVAFQEVLGKSMMLFKGIDPMPRIAIRDMRTRWGSLSDSGLLTLNVRLIETPRECIEYVIIHELCHTTVKNHGPAFYKQLDKRLPDWEKRKAKLELILL